MDTFPLVQKFTAPSQTGKSTLFRGQDKQNETEFDHYLVLRGSDQLLGFIDGDEPAVDEQFVVPITVWIHFKGGIGFTWL